MSLATAFHSYQLAENNMKGGFYQPNTECYWKLHQYITMEYWGHIEKTNQAFMSHSFKGLKSQYFDLLFKRRNVLKMRPVGAFLEVIGYFRESHDVVFQSYNNVSKLTEVVHHSSAKLQRPSSRPVSLHRVGPHSRPASKTFWGFFSWYYHFFHKKLWLWLLKSVDFLFSTWP